MGAAAALLTRPTVTFERRGREGATGAVTRLVSCRNDIPHSAGSQSTNTTDCAYRHPHRRHTPRATREAEDGSCAAEARPTRSGRWTVGGEGRRSELRMPLQTVRQRREELKLRRLVSDDSDGNGSARWEFCTYRDVTSEDDLLGGALSAAAPASSSVPPCASAPSLGQTVGRTSFPSPSSFQPSPVVARPFFSCPSPSIFISDLRFPNSHHLDDVATH